MKTFVTVIVMCFMCSTFVYAQDWEVQIQDGIRALSVSGVLLGNESIEKIYKQNNYSLLWDKRNINHLIEAISLSEAHGLEPHNYHLLQVSSKTISKAERDVLATDAYLSLARHLYNGKLNPVIIEPTWTAKGSEKDLVSYLGSTLKKGDILDSLSRLAPQQKRYKILQSALLRHRKIAAEVEGGNIDSGGVLKPGDVSYRVTQVREKLLAAGNIDRIKEISDVYDESLVEAVKQFQIHNNLEPDGIIGPVTLSKLNSSSKDRINKIRVNLERWRWLPENLGKKHIRVNIADYKLEVHENGEIKNVHDVVVGKTYRKTPVFSSEMSYIVLNPWWSIPSKLARLDILPKFKKDPNVIETLGYKIFDNEGNIISHKGINWNQFSESNFPFRIRQKPGINNALGQVKFMFPNPHDGYIHDTPTRNLFEKVRRDFSSGCIRVNNAIDLVEWVLADNSEWPRKKIYAALDIAKEMRINLKHKISVHLLYWTVVADDFSDDVRFIDDIYERDQYVLSALNSSG